MKFKKIYIEITNICNLKCSFCPTTEREPKFMSLDEFNHILDSIKGYTDYIYLHVKGEPLSHPMFSKFMKAATEKNFFINITTNGTLIKKHCDFLVNIAPPRQINFSLHSFDGNIETIDSGKYLDDIFNFCDLSLENKKTYISLRLWNYNSLEKNHLKNTGNIKILKAIEKHFNLNEELLNIVIPGKGIKLQDNLYLNSDSEFKWPSLKDPILSEKGFCYGLKDHIAILSNGDVIPCCLDENAVIKLGNISKENFSSILNSQKAQNIINGFKSKIAVEELCKKCTFKMKF